MRQPTALALTLLALGLSACHDEPTPVAVEPAPDQAPAPAFGAPSAPAVEALPPSAPAADPNEACAQAIVVAWQGAAYAPATVTRSRDEARAKAEVLRTRLAGGEDFATVARAESDAASSGPRGGLLGTYTREDWPAAHDALKEPVFALSVGQLSDIVQTSYGFAIARRCRVEKVHTAHILVRYRGARNASSDVTRSEAEARQRAEQLRAQAAAPGANFAAIARAESEDASADRGGDLGNVGRGRLAPEYEAAAFELQPGEVSQVVQTEFGFHILKRALE